MVIVEDKGQYEEKEPYPTGLIPAVFSKIYDLGMQPGYEKGSAPVHKMVVLWELGKQKKNGDQFWVTKTYTVSVHEKSSFRKDIENMTGSKLDLKNGEGLDTEKLIGKQCQLLLVADNKDNGDSFVKVSSILPAAAGSNVSITLDNNFVPKWIANIINGPHF